VPRFSERLLRVLSVPLVHSRRDNTICFLPFGKTRLRAAIPVCLESIRPCRLLVESPPQKHDLPRTLTWSQLRCKSVDRYTSSALANAGSGRAWVSIPRKRGSFDPQAAKARAGKKLPYPIENEQKSDELPDARGKASGAVGVFIDRPYDRAQYPATVEWKTGNHVKERESNVDIPQPD
jgi:hypothetical protein